MKTTFLLFLLLLFVLSLPLLAQYKTPQLMTSTTSSIPTIMSYQGILTDNSGVPQNGAFTITFGLYTVPTGGSPLWSETQNSVQVTNGVFNVLLGSVNPLYSSSLSVPSWLSVQVGSTVLSPRIELAASAYSFWASRADTAWIAQCANSVANGAALAIRYISVYNDQGTSAGSFSLDNASSVNKALEVYNSGHGAALYVEARSDGDALSAKANGSGRAGYFQGDVHIAGTLSKTGGSFEIDHPLDPANKILRHSFVESPDMMNIYNGNVTTNANGLAAVELPQYFQTLNKDFRYQLTVIGQFAQAIVVKEIHDNLFTIQTDKPNVKVSWQITGIRKDPWAEKNRVVVEESKSPQAQGSYLNPEVYSKSETNSLGSNRVTNTMKDTNQK